MDTKTSTHLPLQDRVAIVTGASRGIGRAIAIHLGTLGAKIVVNYSSNAAQAEEVVSQISPLGGPIRAISVKADVSDPDQVKSLFDITEETFSSQPHILVATAGVLDPKYPTLAETTMDEFDNAFNVNCKGTFLCCREAAKRVTRDGGGRIITFSSSLAAAFRPGYGAYTASKAAVEAMTKILAKELKGMRITVNCVAPGPIATELFLSGASEERIRGAIEQSPLSRLGEPKDVAPVVGFLVGDDGEWVNGQVVRVNGGFI